MWKQKSWQALHCAVDVVWPARDTLARFMSIETLKLKTTRRTQLVNVTSQVQQAVEKARVTEGMCIVYVLHTTAAVTINECADPDVASDLEGAFDRLIPFEGPYRHEEGNSDSHMKSVLTGASQTIFVVGGQLQLGRWQGIFFCEFDGPRDRRLQVKVIPDLS